jgi:hypothetical protein
MFDAPAFTAVHTAKVENPKNEFTELAGAADCKSLDAIDGPLENAVQRSPGVARFAVQPAGLSEIRSRAAVAPDGAWLARSLSDIADWGS